MEMIDEYLSFANMLADQARDIVSSYSQPQGFAFKSDHSPVTEADKKIEERLSAMIKERYPSHGFLGEETETENLGAELVWILDPIDGTKAFIAGLPVFSTLIALAENGRPKLGLMDFPALSLRFSGASGRPALINGAPCRARKAPCGVVMAVSNPEALNIEDRRKVRALRKMASFAVYGGSSLIYANLALGKIDLCVDGGLDAYDYCPLAPVVEGAGGRMTDWSGKELSIRSGSRVVAAGDPSLHQKALEILSAAQEDADFEGPLLDGPPW
jgi:histidinol phosphatase-like enzyme (inositol monophosphatase family)